MRSHNWSIDACVGESIAQNRFSRHERVCTKTLYNYVDLPQKLKRNTKSTRVRKNKRKLGKSITERANDIEDREEFGHWEIDTVIGKKAKEDAILLTLSERKTRQYLTRIIAGKTAPAVMAAIADVKQEYGEHFADVFKTITSDNGQEFADLSLLEKSTETKVYFTHPYSSFERGRNERHNRLLRRFFPKGHPIADYSMDEIAFIVDWCNHLPRKILGYSTPAEIFKEYLDQIYAA